MFNQDFYPTPESVSREMLKGFNLHNKKVLEPSAGKGDLAKAIQEKGNESYRKISVDVIEKEPELQNILRGMDNLNLVDTDFLSFSPQSFYDYIIMNPPFSNCLEHLKHAMEIGNGATIISLINYDTIFSDKKLAKVLRDEIVEYGNGTIENLGSCFQGSERSTSVRVGLVKFKTRRNSEFDFSFEPQFDQEDDFDLSSKAGAEIAIQGNVFEDYELRYNLACKAYAELLKKGNEFEYYASSISCIPGYEKEDRFYKTISGGEETFDAFRSNFRAKCWVDLFNKTKISNYLPSEVKRKFLNQCETQNAMSFTAKNMRNIFMDLYNNKEGIMQQCVENAFDLMTKYYSENRVHIEGWKSNDRWQVSRKVVLPDMRTTFPLSGDNHVDFDYSRYENLHDIILGLCWLTGKKSTDIEAIPYRAENVENRKPLGVWHDSEFFEWKMFKKGTVHLKFKDENLWKKFNIQACKMKNWLKGEI